MDPKDRLKSDDEKGRYDLHNNDVNDAGYRKFLSRLADPIDERVSKMSRGLDFGCGPVRRMLNVFAIFEKFDLCVR